MPTGNSILFPTFSRVESRRAGHLFLITSLRLPAIAWAQLNALVGNEFNFLFFIFFSNISFENPRLKKFRLHLFAAVVHIYFNPSWAKFPLYFPLKHQKTKGFLVFSGGKVDQGALTRNVLTTEIPFFITPFQ